MSDGKTYTVTWTEISHHERTLEADELASLLGVEVDELDDEDTELDEGLEDSLAQLDDDGFESLTRENIEVVENG